MAITDLLLADHAARKDAEGVAWFTATDLKRLGISGPVLGVFQEAQHALRLRRSSVVAETAGRLDGFSLRETLRARSNGA
ncbi:MAG: hypothetical protein BWY56_01959 [Acidobacteria bacterium ADurb.Bin340]|nr:MAG: hypothetical protein BWY56_01959 [Acidobacteria bacterium ADurb.Bin340]HOD32988.1 hypothetical protein [Holophaga sp.]HQL48992.1 hypothetical protein [Holophaga sp.]